MSCPIVLQDLIPVARIALNYTHNFKNNARCNLGFTTCLLWEGDYQGLGPHTSPAKLSVYQIQNQCLSMPVAWDFILCDGTGGF